ncbi:uncharacterized protein BCR38DRAFT_437164 [Pseudomassariella vexata]|uniref:Uncharacterized protein n=1 Tax=Pseudomassariella vexata TaxID=1141098 RepID=A0A1Y2DWA2_9PEZI|nr:uncharacterized protein BCR38DRAFT_437164 [Pseudomassariella vexata]ORY63561.1 hypothetical protein BCR38DRAFT_437164 [Pseudomassariella vexata]
MLDQVLNGVWGLSEPGGRYSRAVAAFEVWAEKMAGIVAAQRSGDVDSLVGKGEVVFLSELNTSWKGECLVLSRKLDNWGKMLKLLGDGGALSSPPLGDQNKNNDGNDEMRQRSSLARVLEGTGNLVYDMLAELAVMERIEKEATRAEIEWIERMNEELRLDDDTQDSRQVPLWKLVV